MGDSQFDRVAATDTSKYLPENQTRVFAHTADRDMARSLVDGYMALLRLLGVRLPEGGRAIDLGCGAGYITAELKARGLEVRGLEYDEVAVAAARAHNPGVEFVVGDVSRFREPGGYDLIFTREVYLFTRVNAFSDQDRVIGSLIESLRPGGALVLVGSEHSYPHCADYDRLIESARRDPRTRAVSGKYTEQLLARAPGLVSVPLLYRALRLALAPVLWWKSRRGWAEKHVIVFRRA